jgi:UDP-N-acetylmuramoylalanine--D-glutamate ligase
MGLGLFGGGVGVTRHLVARGFDVLVTDLKGETELARSVAELAGLPVRYRLGSHDERDFTGADLVVVNPAVPPGNQFVAAAVAAGVPLDTEIGLFVRGCRGRIVGITGSAGKSTTSALTHACLSRVGLPGRVLLGGNIGRSLLDEMESIAPADVVVLELSSFQLHWLRREALRPQVGVLTNIAPNHLDWHGTIESYAEDKSGIVPAAGGVLVALREDGRVRAIAERAPCRVVWTSREEVPAGDAVFWRGDALIARIGGDEAEVLRRADVRILGEHAGWNVASAAAATLVTAVGGATGRAGTVRDRTTAGGASAAAAVHEGVRAFDGLDHRLKPIGRFRGVLCVDDSKSTTPESAAAALRAFDAPVLLLAGGYDKHADPAPMIAAAGRAKAVVCYGATGPALAPRFEEAGVPDVALVGTLAEAVDRAFVLASEGDVLLLSPGHASWDQFTNYEARAKCFAEAVAAYAVGGSGPAAE